MVGIEKGQKVTISTNFHKSCAYSTKKAAICTHADSRLWFYAVFYWSIFEDLIQFPFHGARLGKFQRIGLTDMVGGDAVTLCKTQNVTDGNAVDDLGGRKAIDLFCEDMFQPLVVVREAAAYFLAAVKALDDFRNVQAGLHVGVQEGLAGVIEQLYYTISGEELF